MSPFWIKKLRKNIYIYAKYVSSNHWR